MESPDEGAPPGAGPGPREGPFVALMALYYLLYYVVFAGRLSEYVHDLIRHFAFVRRLF